MLGFISTRPDSVGSGGWGRSLESPLLGKVQQGISAPGPQLVEACPPTGCLEHLFSEGVIARGYPWA